MQGFWWAVFPAASEPSPSSHVRTLCILEILRGFLIKRRQITGRLLDFWLVINRVFGSPFLKGLLLGGKVWVKTITGVTKFIPILKWLFQGPRGTTQFVNVLESLTVAFSSWWWCFCNLFLVVSYQLQPTFSFYVQWLTTCFSL